MTGAEAAEQTLIITGHLTAVALQSTQQTMYTVLQLHAYVCYYINHTLAPEQIN